MTGRLEGKGAIVTGGSRGQGASHARAFAKEGARVAITDIRADPGEELAKELGERVLFIQHDVASPQDRDRVVAGTKAAFDPINVRVNNAGIVLVRDVADLSLEEYSRVVSINQTSVFLGMKAALPSMRRAGGGSIINISSAATRRGIRGNPAYTAAKTAVLGIGRVAALELAKDNIRVNAVLPGVIQTPMIDVPDTAQVAEMARQIPIIRFAEPQEVSGIVVYPASDEGSYTTGAEISVDGGLTT